MGDEEEVEGTEEAVPGPQEETDQSEPAPDNDAGGDAPKQPVDAETATRDGELLSESDIDEDGFRKGWRKQRKKKKQKKKEDWPALPVEYSPCPHLHFKSDIVERAALSRNQHTDLLATPKGYRWEPDRELRYIKKGKGAGKKKVKKKLKRAPKRTGKDDKEYIGHFLSEIWKSLPPKMVEQLRQLLVEEFGMSEEEAGKFIEEQKAGACAEVKGGKKKKKRPYGAPDLKVGVRHKWIKDFSRIFASKVTDYVVMMLSCRRTLRVRKLAEAILNHFCDITGERTTLNTPKTQVHRIMVFIADRVAVWLDSFMKESEDKKTKDESVEARLSVPSTEPGKKPKKRPSKEEEEGKEGEEGEEKPKSPASKASSKSPSKPSSKAGSKEPSAPGSKEASKPTSKASSKASSKAPSKPGSKEASKQSSKPTSKESSKAGSKVPSKASSKQQIEEEGGEEEAPAEPGKGDAEEPKEEPGAEEEGGVVAEVVEEEGEEGEEEFEEAEEGEEEEEEEAEEEEFEEAEEIEEEEEEEEITPPAIVIPVEEKPKEEIPLVLPPVLRGERSLVYQITKGDGSYFNVRQLSSGTVAEKIAEARKREKPVRSSRKEEVLLTESPLKLETMKEWAEWANKATEVAKEWSKWIDVTVRSAQEKAKIRKGEILGGDSQVEKLTKEDWRRWQAERKLEEDEIEKKKRQLKMYADVWKKKMDKAAENMGPEKETKVIELGTFDEPQHEPQETQPPADEGQEEAEAEAQEQEEENEGEDPGAE